MAAHDREQTRLAQAPLTTIVEAGNLNSIWNGNDFVALLRWKLRCVIACMVRHTTCRVRRT